MYHLLSCLRQIVTAISAFQCLLSPIVAFPTLVRVTQLSQFEKGILRPKS